MKRSHLIIWMGALAVAFWPRAAQAHLVTTGLGPVYDGISHFMISPDDLLPVVALGLFAGLRGPASGRRALFLLPLGWLAGGLAGIRGGIEPQFPLQCISFLLLGVLVASDLALPANVVALLAIAMGAVHGYYNGATMGQAGGPVGTLELIGVACTLFVLTALISALVVSLRREWMRIVVRVAGSWIAAIGLLLLGWTLRRGAI